MFCLTRRDPKGLAWIGCFGLAELGLTDLAWLAGLWDDGSNTKSLKTFYNPQDDVDVGWVQVQRCPHSTWLGVGWGQKKSRSSK